MGKNITFFWIKPDSKKGELTENKNNSIINTLLNQKKRNGSKSYCARRLYSKIKSSLSKETSLGKSSINNNRTNITEGNINSEIKKNKTLKDYIIYTNPNTIINNNRINPEINVDKLELKEKNSNTKFKTLDNNSKRNNIIINAKFNIKNNKQAINLKIKDKIKKINHNTITLTNDTLNRTKNIILCNNINCHNKYIINTIPKITRYNTGLKQINNKNKKKNINSFIINESKLNRNILYKPIFKKV